MSFLADHRRPVSGPHGICDPQIHSTGSIGTNKAILKFEVIDLEPLPGKFVTLNYLAKNDNK